MILVNKNTIQSPLNTGGRTGKQSLRFIPASRVYLCAYDPFPNSVTYFGPFGGATPPGFTDLGVTSGQTSISLSRGHVEAFSGVDKKSAGVFTQSTSCSISFTLSQFDDYAVEVTTGLTPQASVPNVYASYLAGSQPILRTGLMLVTQNKLDGKEWQFYNPNAYLSASFDNSGDELASRVTCVLPGFSSTAGTTLNQVLSITIVAPNPPAVLRAGWGATLYGTNYGN